MIDPKKRAEVLQAIAARGGLRAGVATEVAGELGVPEAQVYGAGSFYHLLADPETKVRVCTGLSCAVRGAEKVLKAAQEAGLPVGECACLAACDRAPAILCDREVLPEVSVERIVNSGGDWKQLLGSGEPEEWRGRIGPAEIPEEERVFDLAGDPDYSGEALARAMDRGVDGVLEEIEASGLQGRGGAGFPAAIKWRGVVGHREPVRYLVLNADEGEPGTFKDRELMLRRPDLVVEGLAIAARTIGAREIYCYLRGEFGGPWRSLETAIAAFKREGQVDGLEFFLHAGHGAYICGEETALLEALEGKRGMPRLKPPFPTDVGLWGKPTLIHNVETIAAVPPIIRKGGAWFRALGRTGPGTKLYCVSGFVREPGTYELPLGVGMDGLLEAAGGTVGELKAFSPGGASSGFLPASHRGIALDFKALSEAGSMLGSAGVVVLNETVDIRWAAREQLRFFEEESCGQCAPCRIGTRFLRRSLDRVRRGGEPGSQAKEELLHIAEAAWEMNEGSICGLGQAAALPLTSVIRHFPEEFSDGPIE